MKRNMMMKTLGMLPSALALMLLSLVSACSSEVTEEASPVGGTWRVSIPADKAGGVESRALSLDGKVLTATFSTEESVHVFNYSTGYLDGEALHPDQNGVSANLVGMLSGNYHVGDDLTLFLNYEVESRYSGYFDYTGQDGTLEGVQKYDKAYANVRVSSLEDGTLKTGSARFTNPQSIFCLSFATEDGSPVKAKKVVISSKKDAIYQRMSITSESVKGDIEVNLPAAADEVYVALAMEDVSLASGDGIELDFQVTDSDGKVYSGSKKAAARQLEMGKFYKAEVHVEKALVTPLTLEAKDAGTITIRNWLGLTIQYSLNGGAKVSSKANTIEITVNKGDKVQLFGDNEAYSDGYGNDTYIKCSADCYVYGNIMSLISSTEYPTLKKLTKDYAFYNLFNGNDHLLNHPTMDLCLPATTLTERCYFGMFHYCRSLTAAPALPATELAEGCYYDMFSYCESLTAAPALPAPTLPERCYESMFQRCKSLTTVPALPATTLAKACYYAMFRNCESLTAAPALSATTLAESCCAYMFEECTSLTTSPALPATTLAENCYECMFEYCTSLTTAPALPATTLAKSCYERMFEECTSLTTAPVLPATKLADYCYADMFEHCSKLSKVECYATDLSADGCTSWWLHGVSASGEFIKAKGVLWPSGNRGIPEGWTVTEK